MTEPATNLTSSSLEAVQRVVLPSGVDPAAPLELVVSVAAPALTAREFAGLLAVIDRVHGRFAVGNLRSYARKQKLHLQVTDVGSGSIDLVLSVAQELAQATPLILLFLALKFLPAALEAGTRAVRNLAQAHQSYQEGELARERRRQLRRQLDTDQTFRALPAPAKQEVEGVLAEVYEAEVPGMSRDQQSAIESLGPPQLRPRRSREGHE